MKNGLIAVDFDGTVVEHDFPAVGKENPGAVRVLRRLVANGCKLILWTMRSDSEEKTPLADAVKWFEERNIPLFGINENPKQGTWSTSPKAYAQVYIDDAALGCPLRPAITPGGRLMVDWAKVEKLFFGEDK